MLQIYVCKNVKAKIPHDFRYFGAYRNKIFTAPAYCNLHCGVADILSIAHKSRMNAAGIWRLSVQNLCVKRFFTSYLSYTAFIIYIKIIYTYITKVSICVMYFCCKRRSWVQKIQRNYIRYKRQINILVYQTLINTAELVNLKRVK